MDSLKNTHEGLFRIEDAQPGDVEAMRTIVKNAWLALYPNDEYGITAEDISAIDWYDPEAMARRKKEITEKRETVHVWVLKNERNEVVGFCKATRLDETMGEIDAMYVAAELQGKGFGKKLMDKALEWLGPNVDIKLKVVKYNSRAIEFYKKTGLKNQEMQFLMKAQGFLTVKKFLELRC